ncbi:hypothetical protein [Reyranella soli]|uniref:Uncharacterized protein n=1 Tax=Reyranella soli TaxID=1230389 RepID=A0A512NMH2_9HYPH|nr:hypothetical protein [Reyranella soli]GEP60122.1 hypothetical protein RSO01_72880 [Reyranella soli]
MSEIESGSATSLREWQMALSRWDNEGGAGPQQGAVSSEAQSKILQLTNAELAQLGTQHHGHALRRGLDNQAEAGPSRCGAARV